MKRKRQNIKRKQNLIDNQNKEEISEIHEMENKSEKTKEQILAERQATKAAKQQVKKEPTAAPKVETKNPQPALVSETKASVQKPQPPSAPQTKPAGNPESTEMSKDQILAEREAKKLAKLAKKKGGAEQVTNDKPIATKAPVVVKSPAKPVVKIETAAVKSPAAIVVKMEQLKLANDETSEKIKQVPSKAERRAVQEAQRAMKAKALEDKKAVITKTTTKVAVKKTIPVSSVKVNSVSVSSLHKVKLFKHLYKEKCSLNLNVNNTLHPAIVKLGIQYANDTVVGSNSRCYAFLYAMKKVII